MANATCPPYLGKAPPMLEKLPDVVGHVLRGQRAGLDKTAFHLSLIHI